MTIHLPPDQTFLTSLVSISPEQNRHVAPDLALQRLNFVTGRNLTERAVEIEQVWTEARMGVAGRWLSAGVVTGLAVSMADQAADPGVCGLGAGRGITGHGQDVSVLKQQGFAIDDLQLLGSAEGSETPPRGLIVVALEPVVIEVERLPGDGTRLSAFEDPCPADATSAPFLDFVLVDAARLAYAPLEDALAGPDPARAPNIAAQAVRALEAASPSMPAWAAGAVPLCLMFIAPDGAIAWMHRAAVVRQGGLLPQTQLRRTKIDFDALVKSLVEETAMATRIAGWDGTDMAAVLRHLPAAGILPRKCWDRPGSFPAGWAIAHAPIPMSQLDAALEAASRLASFDLDVDIDRLKILVPVPDALYAADLLEPFALPDFGPLRTRLQGRVGDTLALRNAYRGQARVVQGVIDLSGISNFVDAEEDPVPGETAFPANAPDPAPHDTEAHAILIEIHTDLSPVLFTDGQIALVDPARLAGPLTPDTDQFGVTPFVNTMRRVIDTANDMVDFAFNRVQAEIYRLRQIMLDNEESTKLATFPALAGLAKGSNAYALSEGLKTHFLANQSPPTGQPTTPPPSAPAPGPVFFGAMLQPLVLMDAGTSGRDNATFVGTGNTGSFLRDSVVLGGNTGIGFDSGANRLDNTTFLSGFGDNGASLSFGVNFGDVANVKGDGITLVKDLVDNTRAELVDDALLADAKSKRTGIMRAAPLPGDIRDVRSATVADRLKSSSSVDAKVSAVRIKADVLSQLQKLEMSLEGLNAPLTSSRDRVLLPKADIDAVIAQTLSASEQTELSDTLSRLRRPVADSGSGDWELMGVPEAEPLTGGSAAGVTPLSRLGAALLTRNAPISMTLLPALALSKQLDPDPGKGGTSDDRTEDESAYLGSAIATLEGTIAILRKVEARALSISGVVDDVAAEIKRLNGIQTRWFGALAQADQDLDEARHDLRVGISLIAEETQRLTAKDEARQKILAEEVKFVAFTRPRALAPHSEGTRLGLRLPGTFEDPVPEALRRDVALPEALEDMIGALREMPIGWFTVNPEFDGAFAKPAYLDHLLGAVNARARTTQMRWEYTTISAPGLTAPAAAQVQRISASYTKLTQGLVQGRVAYDPVQSFKKSWLDRKREALALLSLNDLIGSGRQPRVANRASAEVERIERVLHAFWQFARQVPAPIRLLWAQALSEYDTVSSLEVLAKLPGWDQVDFSLRAKMTRLNSWLFARMETTPAEAKALMTDVIRVALLIAAHAPVAEIIAANLEEEQTVRPGGLVDIVIRRGNPRIGAKVSFLDANLVQATGTIQDLYGSRAQVAVTYTATPLVNLTPLQSVTLYEPQTLFHIAT